MTGSSHRGSSHLITGASGNPFRPCTLEAVWRRTRTAVGLLTATGILGPIVHRSRPSERR